MFPTIACMGPFCLRTLNVFLVLAFLLTSFIFYRKVREEHYPEMEAFDGYLLSILVGLIAGRLAYILFHLSEFGKEFWKWADVVSKPGFLGTAGLVVSGLYLFRHAKRFTSDSWQVLDIWSIAVSAGLCLGWLGMLLDGSGYGFATTLPIGWKFPGLVEPHMPIQAASAVFFLFLGWYLNWVEYRYRTFGWYRSGKTSAQSGFLISVFVIASSAWMLLLSWLRPAQFLVAGIQFDSIIASAGMVIGISMLYVRSGRTFRAQRKHPNAK